MKYPNYMFDSPPKYLHPPKEATFCCQMEHEQALFDIYVSPSAVALLWVDVKSGDGQSEFRGFNFNDHYPEQTLAHACSLAIKDMFRSGHLEKILIANNPSNKDLSTDHKKIISKLALTK